MLQQTQVVRVIPKYQAWLRRWPTARALALASLADVMKLWTGLGYNRRAKMLRDAARLVVEQHGGRWPTNIVTLPTLPGFGPYTAAAVAVFSGRVRATMIDTNVRRVIGRWFFGIRHVPPNRIERAAEDVLPATKADEWHHALMDLGATVCLPRPKCELCPVRDLCDAYPQILTIKPKRRTPVTRFIDSQRYVRGRIMARLTRGSMRRSDLILELRMKYELPNERTKRAITSLINDGLLVRSGARVRLNS